MLNSKCPGRKPSVWEDRLETEDGLGLHHFLRKQGGRSVTKENIL